MRSPLWCAAVLLMVVARSSTAQSASLRLTMGGARIVRPVVGADTSRVLTGTAWGLDGALALGRVTLGIRYGQASVSQGTGVGTGNSLDVVDGEIILWVAPVRWGAIGLGPHARAFVEQGGTERWVLWELRARGTRRLIGDVLGAYLEGWAVPGASAPVTTSFNHGWGMEGGLRFFRDELGLLVGRFPFQVQLRYRVEQQSVGDDGARETQGQFGIAVGIGRR